MQVGGEGDQTGLAGGSVCGDPAAGGEQSIVLGVREQPGDVIGHRRRGQGVLSSEGQGGDAREALEGDVRHEDAAQSWELEFAEMMVEAGLMQGSYSACVFYHEEKEFELLYMETILHCRDDVEVWIGSGKSVNVAWR